MTNCPIFFLVTITATVFCPLPFPLPFFARFPAVLGGFPFRQTDSLQVGSWILVSDQSPPLNFLTRGAFKILVYFSLSPFTPPTLCGPKRPGCMRDNIIFALLFLSTALKPSALFSNLDSPAGLTVPRGMFSFQSSCLPPFSPTRRKA